MLFHCRYTSGIQNTIQRLPPGQRCFSGNVLLRGQGDDSRNSRGSMDNFPWKAPFPSLNIIIRAESTNRTMLLIIVFTCESQSLEKWLVRRRHSTNICQMTTEQTTVPFKHSLPFLCKGCFFPSNMEILYSETNIQVYPVRECLQ